LCVGVVVDVIGGFVVCDVGVIVLVLLTLWCVLCCCI